MPAAQAEKYVARGLSAEFLQLVSTAETERVLRKMVRRVMKVVMEIYMIAVVGVEYSVVLGGVSLLWSSLMYNYRARLTLLWLFVVSNPEVRVFERC
jgi:hypothetical protein